MSRSSSNAPSAGAANARRGGQTDADRISYASAGRLPPATGDEKTELLSLLQKQKKPHAEAGVNANELATGKNEAATNLPKGATPTQLAAYTVVTRVLLNLDETITKE